MDLGADGVENPDRFRDRADVSVTVGERFSLGKVSLSRCRIGYLTMHDTDLRQGKMFPFYHRIGKPVSSKPPSRNDFALEGGTGKPRRTPGPAPLHRPRPRLRALPACGTACPGTHRFSALIKNRRDSIGVRLRPGLPLFIS